MIEYSLDQINSVKANVDSPTFTGTPTAPTATAGTSTAQVATTAFVTAANNNLQSQINTKAPLSSPVFTGRVTGPTGSGSSGGFGFDNDTGMVSSGDGNLKFYTNNVYAGGPITATNNWDINITGNAGSVSKLSLTDSNNPVTGPDTTTQNTIGYVNSLSLLGQSDGALYSQAYSTAWQHQIYGDYRTGSILIRGKNNGTWTAWNKVWHSGNGGSGSGLNADLLDGYDSTYFAPIASPALTGTPTAPTAAAGTSSTQLATTAFVTAANTSLQSQINGKVGISDNQTITGQKVFSSDVVLNNSTNDTPSFRVVDPTNNSTFEFDMAVETPRFMTVYRGGAVKIPLTFDMQTGSVNLQGVSTATTAPAGTSTTQVATTAFVTAADNLKANIASPIFTGQVFIPEGTASLPALVFQNDGSNDTGLYHISDGNIGVTCNAVNVASFTPTGVNLQGTPTAPTAAAGTSTTQLATTAFVTTANNNLQSQINGKVGLTGNQTITGSKTFSSDVVLNNSTNDTPSFRVVDPVNNTTCEWDMASETPRFFGSYRGGALTFPLTLNIQTGEVNGQNGVLSGYTYMMIGGDESSLPYNTTQTRLSSANFTAKSNFVSGVCKAAVNNQSSNWNDVLMTVVLVDITANANAATWQDQSSQVGNLAAGGKLIVPFSFGTLTIGHVYRIDMQFLLQEDVGPTCPKYMLGMFHH
jgi:hypothetical protein